MAFELDLTRTFGAMNIATFIASALQGVLTVQVRCSYNYECIFIHIPTGLIVDLQLLCKIQEGPIVDEDHGVPSLVST